MLTSPKTCVHIVTDLLLCWLKAAIFWNMKLVNKYRGLCHGRRIAYCLPLYQAARSSGSTGSSVMKFVQQLNIIRSLTQFRLNFYNYISGFLHFHTEIYRSTCSKLRVTAIALLAVKQAAHRVCPVISDATNNCNWMKACTRQSCKVWIKVQGFMIKKWGKQLGHSITVRDAKLRHGMTVLNIGTAHEIEGEQ